MEPRSPFSVVVLRLRALGRRRFFSFAGVCASIIVEILGWGGGYLRIGHEDFEQSRGGVRLLLAHVASA